jgi:death-on-curing protein
MIDIKIANKIHDKLIERIGGGKGIRDKGVVEAAPYRPNATFDGVDLYPTAIDKAAALFESIIINHPFIDGNKRTAYVLMKYLLFKNDIAIEATKDEKYQMTIDASKGDIRFDEIKLWLQSKTKNQ